jgi:hypothetical protein
MKCSDIPTRPILEFLERIHPKPATAFDGYEESVSLVMPMANGKKLVLAKMKKLINAGLVEGCACGCRGDFLITDKGRLALNHRLPFLNRSTPRQ